MAHNSENPATPPGAAGDTHEPDQHQTGDLPQLLKRFRFLAAKQANQQQTVEHSSSTSESVQSQISQYVSEVRDGSFVSSSSVLAFWQERQLKCDKLAPVALDILAAQASHAFVERIVSVCGLLTNGRVTENEFA